MKFVIIGGVAAGMSAAAKISRLAPGSPITVYESGGHISYGACGLPYYISGDNPDESKLFIRSIDDFRKQGVNVLTYHQVVKVVPEHKRIMVRRLDTGDLFIDSYDKLLIAAGGSAIRPELPGVRLPGVFTLKTVNDANALKKASASADSVVVAGGGYIGVEVCEAMVKLGKKVVLLEGGLRILSGFSPELSALAQKELERWGVSVKQGERLLSIEGDRKVSAAITNFSSYPCDLLVLALGVRPATDFLKKSGIRLTSKGAVEVDRNLRTNYPDIYAAGDCSAVYHRILEKNVYIPLGTVANKCGRLAGENMAGGNGQFEGALGSAAIKVMDLEFGRTGLSEDEARMLDVSFDVASVTSNSGPGYYPGHSPIITQLVFDRKSGRILGGCSGGKKGAVLRIDALAAAITGNATVKELGQMDFCYAPPFSEVWDSLNVAGNYAESTRKQNGK